MGYVLRSAFWLGLVYYAMPLGQLPQVDLSSRANLRPEALLCSSANVAIADRLGPLEPAYRDAAAVGCVAALASGTAAPVQAKSAPQDSAPIRQASAQSLTDRDRQPVWIGRQSPPLPPAPRPKQS